jgi:hypothetical protein
MLEPELRLTPTAANVIDVSAGAPDSDHDQAFPAP